MVLESWFNFNFRFVGSEIRVTLYFYHSLFSVLKFCPNTTFNDYTVRRSSSTTPIPPSSMTKHGDFPGDEKNAELKSISLKKNFDYP